MADQALCTIPDCGKPVMARGWCNSHYLRWYRHGSTERGRTQNGTLLKEVQRALAEATPEHCWEWPYGRASSGYGHVNFGGRNMGAHRLVCMLARAEDGAGLEAAHSCGNRGCINPHHLRFATSAENSADRILHGTQTRGERNHSAKLKADDVREIRRLGVNRGTTMKEIGARFGVSHSTVSDILNGKRWRELLD